MAHYLPSRAQVLTLYRHLLRHAAVFPSRKRAGILSDIRLEFRERASLAEPAARAQAWEVGVRGLDTMKKYTTLDARAPSWSIDLEQNPLGLGAEGGGGGPGGAAP